MRTRLSLRSVVTLLSLVAASSAYAEKKIAYTPEGVPYVKGEMIVKTRSGAALERFLANTAPTLESLTDRHPIAVTSEGAWYKVQVNTQLETESVMTESVGIDGVLYAEPNYIYHTSIGPINPKPTQPKAPDMKVPPALPNPPMPDPDLSKLYGLSKIHVSDAWKTSSGSKKVIVADIDTGIDYNHVDLMNNLWKNPGEIPGNGIDDDHNGVVDDTIGYNYRDKSSLPFDDNEHGSHTAGTIAATGGNGIGISGVSQSASIMALRFLGGSDGSGTLEDALLCIQYATQNGAMIMSNSWGGGGYSQAMYDAIKAAGDKGILFVAAAGNESNNNDSKASYPASYDLPNVISVAATDSGDGMAYFSNYGLKTVHLGAPGVGIYSTIPGNKYAAFDGTSMATPHVSGAAALIKAAFPKLEAKEIKALLLDSVDAVASLSGKTITGGRLNVGKAMALAQERYGSGPSDFSLSE